MKRVYSIRQGTNVLELTDTVNQDMMRGWKPQGGVCVAVLPPDYNPMFLYFQAVVLEVDENPGEPTP